MKKKMLAGVVTAVLIGALTACGGNTASQQTTAAAQTEAAKTEAAKTEAAKPDAKDALMFRVSMPEASNDNKAVAIQQVVRNIEERTGHWVLSAAPTVL